MGIGGSEPCFPHPLVRYTGSRSSPGGFSCGWTPAAFPVLPSKPLVSPSVSFLYQLPRPSPPPAPAHSIQSCSGSPPRKPLISRDASWEHVTKDSLRVNLFVTSSVKGLQTAWSHTAVMVIGAAEQKVERTTSSEWGWACWLDRSGWGLGGRWEGPTRRHRDLLRFRGTGCGHMEIGPGTLRFIFRQTVLEAPELPWAIPKKSFQKFWESGDHIFWIKKIGNQSAKECFVYDLWTYLPRRRQGILGIDPAPKILRFVVTIPRGHLT